MSKRINIDELKRNKINELRSLLKESMSENEVFEKLDAFSLYNNLNKIVLFGNLVIRRTSFFDEWKIKFNDCTFQGILKTIPSGVTFSEYLECVSETIKVLKRILPTFPPKGFVTFKEEDSTTLQELSVLCKLQTLIKSTSKLKTYLTNLDDIEIPSIGLKLSLSYAEDELSFTKKTDGYTTMWIPYRTGASIDEILNKCKVIEYINWHTLQRMFVQESNFLLNNRFSVFFNETFRKTFLRDSYYYEIDFYSKIKEANPKADLFEIFFLHKSISIESDLFEDSLKTEDPTRKMMAVKTLQGYYYINEDDKSVGFLSLEDYEKKALVRSFNIMQKKSPSSRTRRAFSSVLRRG